MMRASSLRMRLLQRCAHALRASLGNERAQSSASETWGRNPVSLAAAAGCAVAAAGCAAATASCEPEPSASSWWFWGEKKSKRTLRRQASEGVARRGLVRCNGGEEELKANYEILEGLGRGGFATVRRAVHRGTGLRRAVKTVLTGEHDEPEKAEKEWDRMLMEVEALMDLTHPNIVQLFEYYRSDKALHLVEEYCSGGTLEARLEEKGGRLAEDEVAVVMRQVLRGVLCCHAHGLAHRDLKPDNFVFSSREPQAALKLIDFGLSLGPRSASLDQLMPAPGRAEALPDWTSSYANMAGTLEHTAPETFPQSDASGKSKRLRYSQAADLWSVGAIFFRCLTGEPLVDLDRERSSSAEFARMLKGVVDGVERDLMHAAAQKVRSEKFIADRLLLARKRASIAACDLLEQLLLQDPTRRITAPQALEHRFIVDSYLKTPRGHGVFDADMVSKMRRFAEAPALRRLAVLVEAHLLGPQGDPQVEKAALTFRAADERGLGKLSAEDIAAALRSQGLEVPADLGEICERLDVSKDGSVNLLEFVAATMEPRLFCEPTLCRAAFRVLDADADGWISKADLENVLTESPQRGRTATAVLRSSVRTDDSDRVDFKAFCETMLPRDVDKNLSEKVAQYMMGSFV